MRLLISLVLGLKLLPWQQSGYDSIFKSFQEGKRFLIYGLSVGTVQVVLAILLLALLQF